MAPKRIEEWFDIWNDFFEVGPSYAFEKNLSFGTQPTIEQAPHG